MSDFRVLSGTSAVTRVTADGDNLALRGTRTGIPYVTGWEQAMAMEGRMFQAEGGTITAPITFGAGVILETEADYMMTVPNGTVAIITSVEIAMETYGTTAIFEFMAAVGVGGVIGTSTAATPTNLRSDAPIASKCTVGVAGDTASATYMTSNVSEFFRGCLSLAVTIGTADDDSVIQKEVYTWSASKTGVYPVVVGAGGMSVYAAAQAGTGFITVTWVELPSNQLV